MPETETESTIDKDFGNDSKSKSKDNHGEQENSDNTSKNEVLSEGNGDGSENTSNTNEATTSKRKADELTPDLSPEEIEINSCPFNWCEYLDSTSQKYYYYNLITKKTQWEKPVGFVSPSIQVSAPTVTQNMAQDIVFKATFNKKTGAFSGNSDAAYFERMGRPEDRAGRQMAAFFDTNKLDENRQQAKEIQKKLANSDIDWRKYKEEKKIQKQKRNNEWLFKDD